MKKLIKILLITVIIIISNFAIVANTVQALEQQEIKIYTTGNLSRILKYDGMLIKTAHAVYEENGKQYPVYCLNKDLQGVGDQVASYETINGGKITDIGLWRVIINGYPYKSLESLGVASEEEAYIATKQSIYCYIYNRGTEKYSGVGEAGERTVKAMNIILSNAKNSTENFENQKVEILQSEKWVVDNFDTQYISKEYQVKSDINISKYTITLEKEPKGCKVTDINNQEKSEFNSNEKFKILIPISSLEESGEFKINIKTQMETKPIFYGKAPSSNLQDYALTAFSYEDVQTDLIQEYYKNDTEITIKKQDEKTEKCLSGAVFEILDENKNVIQTLITNEDGIIEIKQILPGTYYIKELQAPEGYETNSELYQVEIGLNQKITLAIENSQIIIEEPKEEIKQEEPKLEEVRRLPVTGM